MRISVEQRDFLKELVVQIEPSSKSFLFGSRIDDSKAGGDIDLLILADRRLRLKERLYLKRRFKNRYGEQKLDILTFAYSDDHPLKNYLQSQIIPL